MNGKTDEDIAIERNIAIKEIRNMHKDEKVWILDTFISEAYFEKHPGLKYLAESIRMLDEADEMWMLPKCGKRVYARKGWLVNQPS